MKRALIVCLVAAACLLLAFRPERQETWQTRTLAQMEWSEPRSAAGSSFEKRPPAFALGVDGSLLMVDSALNSLRVYDQKGVSHSIALDVGAMPEEIEIAQDGSIFGVTRGRQSVARYTLEGTHEIVYSQSSGDLYFIEAIGVFGSGTLYVQEVSFTGEGYSRRLTRVSLAAGTANTLTAVDKSRSGVTRHLGNAPVSDEVDDFVVSQNGSLIVLSGSVDAYSRTVTVVSPSQRAVKFTIREPEHLRAARLLGTDMRGNVYVGLSVGNDESIVQKYAPKGQKLDEIRLRGFTGAGEIRGRVDASGNVYVMRVQDSGFYIDQYSSVSETKWVPRFPLARLGAKGD